MQPGYTVANRETSQKKSPPSPLRHLDMSMQLTDKVIIITGGCQGLGRSMAEYLAGKGAKLALVDLNQEKNSTRRLPRV
nr:hypothetical protein GCM10020185_53450 [Pseudomonas brassicacearum subsp. brassicacearum]